MFGVVFAHEAAKKGKKIKVIEKRDHIAGNIYTKEVEGIQVHEYGAHIFHTSEKEIWDYVNQFAEFNRYNVDFFANKEDYLATYPKIVFTGMIDEFFDYQLGELEYRSLRFETEVLDMENYQGNAVVNYTDSETPYTRIIEHKHFEFGTQEKTIITREYSKTWKRGDEPYYPVNNDSNKLYTAYKRLAEQQENVIFGGRLGHYRYYDMHQVIGAALQCV
ncbi:UDP-galactopyranose mutase [Streptococcus suis]|uniref:UDP-galactopyranose mutase n=1 Tax=Streptococcus suis TaxID=1307 RepID=UPI0029C1C8BA|nr:UDP-galactopyranose mutase [Streptococcus suis]MDX4992826.1 UDP-galactopyranose mutase [Streptococcus suis]HEL1829119.1 NAD(P)-binding protein [Streptococcus suis]HEL1999388.1 NAD(P)-binding protein [Streptococcus suis]HEL2178901.1 NAD(P)-binding protein [Streptococcus suis]HEL2259115.1 NAD(P)-binding protein [Streptococcus suis]